jgi:ribosomal protein L11 methylase PrmA
MARERRIELVDEEVDLGSGLRARITRPREPERLLDDAVSDAIELGCGLALPSVAAALRGAEVLAVDHDAAAVRIARRNGRRAGRRVRGLVADLRDPADELVEAGPFDLVLAADVLYLDVLAEALATLIPLLTAPAGRALVAFPWHGQADELARALERAGMRVALRELDAPGLLHARTVGLLEASR